MLKDITLGQYYPAESPIHRLDPRTKLLLMIAFIVAVFLVDSMVMYIPLFAFIVVTLVIANIPLSYLWRALKPMKWLLVFMFFINLFLISTGDALVELYFIKITMGGLRQAAFVVIRLIILVCGTSLLTLTTTPISLTDGIESLLSPLKVIKFPAHELAMIMTIALRFIPTLLEEADKIMKAQSARGAKIDTGNLIQRAKGMMPILIPLFISAFRRADELAMAMESRCYHGGEGRTKLHKLGFMPRDLYAALIMSALIAMVVTVQAVWL